MNNETEADCKQTRGQREKTLNTLNKVKQMNKYLTDIAGQAPATPSGEYNKTLRTCWTVKGGFLG